MTGRYLPGRVTSGAPGQSRCSVGNIHLEEYNDKFLLDPQVVHPRTSFLDDIRETLPIPLHKLHLRFLELVRSATLTQGASFIREFEELVFKVSEVSGWLQRTALRNAALPSSTPRRRIH